MDDLISRHAAIELIENESRKWGDEYGVSDVLCDLADLPPAQPEQRWIPCNEMLPEYDGEMYLVTDYCEQINRRRIHISYCYVNREGFWSDVPIGYKVIAWMQLPDPYLGEGRSE